MFPPPGLFLAVDASQDLSQAVVGCGMGTGKAVLGLHPSCFAPGVAGAAATAFTGVLWEQPCLPAPACPCRVQGQSKALESAG